MPNAIQNEIDYYLQQDLGKLSLSEIRAELRDKNINEEDIREIVALIDEYKLQKINQSTKANYEISHRTLGLVILFIGIVSTVLTIHYLGIIFWFFSCLLIIAGLYLIFAPVNNAKNFKKPRIRNKRERHSKV